MTSFGSFDDPVVGRMMMVAGCPKCSARYRVDADRIGPEGAKLRCTKCSAVFLVRPPRARAAVADPSPPEVGSAAVERPAASVPDPETPGQRAGSERLVLVADPDEARGKATADAIRRWGLDPVLVHDGVEAMLGIQRMLPSVIVLDAALPKMFGFQICEVVKRNESLRDTKVVLVGAIHHQDRYRRDPSDLYGADVYVESPDLPDALRPLLEESGLVGPESVNPASRTVPNPDGVASPPSRAPEFDSSVVVPPEEEKEAPVASASASASAPPAPAPSVEAEDPEKTAERERAERLARIAVSEMVLYQPDKFDQAARDGTLEQALDLEIQEAQALLRQRIGEEVRAETDFILDELHRVAKERSAGG